MSRNWLDEALRATGLRSESSFPRDLMADVVMQLPVSIVPLAGLSAHAVRRWLGQRCIQHEVSDTDRALHGCLVARAGQGILFINAGDEESERRFTLAHEIAHFILDHLLPRLRVLKVFGSRIRPVLDGERPPTREEMLSAVLDRVRLGVQVHLMSRGADGAVCAWDVEESEQRADRLALELLAPAHAATASLRRVIGETTEPAVQQERAAQHMSERFGLPANVADSYIRLLLDRRRRQPSLSEEIFGGRK